MSQESSLSIVAKVTGFPDFGAYKQTALSSRKTNFFKEAKDREIAEDREKMQKVSEYIKERAKKGSCFEIRPLGDAGAGSRIIGGRTEKGDMFGVRSYHCWT